MNTFPCSSVTTLCVCACARAYFRLLLLCRFCYYYTILTVQGQALMELSKEKSSQKQAESQSHQFVKTLSHVESKLTEQINYLTQVSTGKGIYINYLCTVLSWKY